MHTYPSCVTLADGHFRLNAPLNAQEKARRSGRAIGACLELALRPRQGGQSNRWDRRLLCGALLAVLLHALCFGLLMAHSYYYKNWVKPGVISAQGTKDGPPGILLGKVSLSALHPPGTRAPFAQEPQASQPPVGQEPQAASPPTPQEPPAAETTASADPAAEAVPAITPKTTRPAQKKQPAPLRRAKAGTSIAAQRKPAAPRPQGETSTAQASGSAASSTDTGTAGIAGAGGGAEASGGLAVFDGSEGPSFKRFVKPEYPAQARRQGITGQVLLRIHLTSKGDVERVEVVESAHDLLSKAALEAVGRSSFHPLRRNGQPVSCSTLLPISFSLERT